MAERFGGRYSPGGGPSGPVSAPPAAPKVTGKWRTTVLFLTAFLFLFPAFGDGPREMLLGLLAGGLIVLATIGPLRSGVRMIIITALVTCAALVPVIYSWWLARRHTT